MEKSPVRSDAYFPEWKPSFIPPLLPNSLSCISTSALTDIIYPVSRSIHFKLWELDVPRNLHMLINSQPINIKL